MYGQIFHKIVAMREWRHLALAATLLCGVAGQAHSQQAQPQSERLVYNIMVGGLHLGDAMIGLNQTENSYATEMRMNARGMAKWVRNFSSDMRGEGQLLQAATNPTTLDTRPALYSRQWSTGEVAADMTMKYDANGKAEVEERYFNPETSEPIAHEDLPWNKDDSPSERQRKPVPDAMRTNVLDPMAAFIAARGQLMAQGLAAKGPKRFRVPIYDGRRRYDIVGRAEAPRTTEIAGTERSVITVIAKLEPVFGFSRKSQVRMEESEGKFLFSNDNRFIPLQLVVSNDLLSGVMNLTADCSMDATPCDTFGQEKDGN